MSFFTRYVSRSARIVTTYMVMETMTSGTSQAVFDTLLQVLNYFGVPVCKVMSLGSDGAAVMVGVENGVAARLTTLNPHCVPVHCCCHRLNLSVSDMCKRHADVQVCIFLKL